MYRKKEPKKASAMDIAKYIIDKCTREQHAINNYQLQNILYFLQRDCLKREKCLFEDDFCAWQFGPVIPAVYYWFCGAGASKITMKYDIDLDQKLAVCIDPIIEELRDKPPWELMEAVHKPHMAYAMMYDNGKGDRRIISKNMIRKYG